MKTSPLFLLSLALLSLAPVIRADSRDRDDDRRRGESRVIVFEHADYRGGALVLYPGDAIENLKNEHFDNGARVNDSISSIRVEGDAAIVIYEDPAFRGEPLRVTENVRDLSGRLIAGKVGTSWNDRVSALKVERARGGGGGGRDPGRPGGGNHNPPPRGDPEKIIKATFKDILDREPDAAELRDFRARFLDHDWTERMLRDYLRNENRYRTEAADKIIYRAFRELFGREPDERAMQVYRRNILDRNWSENDVRDDLRKSPEYRAKQQH